MAIYTTVSKLIPSNERTAIITAVAAGDQIDILEILGRPARGIQFHMTSASDTISYYLNNKKKIIPSNQSEDIYNAVHKAWGIGDRTPVEFWSKNDLFTSTGTAILETVENLKISSIEVVSLTLSSGTTISIVVW